MATGKLKTTRRTARSVVLAQSVVLRRSTLNPPTTSRAQFNGSRSELSEQNPLPS